MATTRIPRDFKEFLKLLDAHSARFLLIGGYAVNAFGYVRNTVDMDVWIAVDADNQQKVLQAIRDFAFPDVPDDLLHEEDAMVRMGQPPLRIEVLKKISGVEFEDCWRRRAIIEDDDLRIPTISLEDLKRNKLASGASGRWTWTNCLNVLTFPGVYGATRPTMALLRCVRDLANSQAILPG